MCIGGPTFGGKVTSIAEQASPVSSADAFTVMSIPMVQRCRPASGSKSTARSGFFVMVTHHAPSMLQSRPVGNDHGALSRSSDYSRFADWPQVNASKHLRHPGLPQSSVLGPIRNEVAFPIEACAAFGMKGSETRGDISSEAARQGVQARISPTRFLARVGDDDASFHRGVAEDLARWGRPPSQTRSRSNG